MYILCKNTKVEMAIPVRQWTIPDSKLAFEAMPVNTLLHL